MRACAFGAKGSDILSDCIDLLPERQARSRRNPTREPVHEIVVRRQNGNPLRLLTNDLDAPAQEIADLYKRRWDIELFFPLVKQTLRITKFLGRSENAVRIQITVVLIAYLLLSACARFATLKLTLTPSAAHLPPTRGSKSLDKSAYIVFSFIYSDSFIGDAEEALETGAEG